MNTRAKAIEIINDVILWQGQNRDNLISLVRGHLEQVRADQAERMNEIAAGRHPDAKVAP